MVAPQLACLRATHEAACRCWASASGPKALAAALGGSVSARRERDRLARWRARRASRALVHLARGLFDLPPGATSRLGRLGVQAFAVGPSTGLQFHPEVTPAIVEDWLRRAAAPCPTPSRCAPRWLRRGCVTRSRLRALRPRRRPLAALSASRSRYSSGDPAVGSGLARRSADEGAWLHRRLAARGRAGSARPVRAGRRAGRRLRRGRRRARQPTASPWWARRRSACSTSSAPPTASARWRRAPRWSFASLG